MHSSKMARRPHCSINATKKPRRASVVRRIMRYAQPYRVHAAVFLIATTLDATTTAAYPVLLALIIDRGILPRRPVIVLLLALVIGMMSLLDAGVNLVQRWCAAHIAQSVICDLRAESFDHVQRQSTAFFLSAKTGSLVSRLDTDMAVAQRALSVTFPVAMSSILQITLILAVMFAFSWLVSLITVLLIPLLLIPARVIGRKLRRLTRESMQLNAVLGSFAAERFNVSGAVLVKLFGRRADELRTFVGYASKARNLGVSTSVYGWTLFIILGFVGAIATSAIYGVGGILVIDRAIQLGTLVALTSLLVRLYVPVNQLSSSNANITSTLVAFERIFELLDFRPTIVEQPDALSLSAAYLACRISTSGCPDVIFDRVLFRFPEPSEASPQSLQSSGHGIDGTDAGQPALCDISFSAPGGKFTALVGRSGAGKTTITRLVSRLYDPVQGSVQIGGVDLRKVSFASLNEVVGVVTQDSHLFHDSIRANLAYARQGATEEDMEAACRSCGIWDLIRGLPNGLDTTVGDGGHRFSAGEKQRIAIARLVLRTPAVVVLDEATAHLDAESEEALLHVLREILADSTWLVVTHRLATIRRAHQILVLDKGAIRECGRHADLLAMGGLYSDMCQSDLMRD
jgi:ATP-binding cassette, subfamily B, bacterial